jgi:hypothetical protein
VTELGTHSLTRQRGETDAPPDIPETLQEHQGYYVLSSTHDRTNFWAVSDVNADELRQFAQLVRDRASK